MKKIKRLSYFAAAAAILVAALPLTACAKNDKTLTLRVANWEEYIDEGGWEEDERIEIDNAYGENGVLGVNEMIDDFADWFNAGDYGFEVKIEYSTFGTNEDLYNRLNLGDKYDVVCPSDYMIMKLLNENKLEPFSESFFQAEETNYYFNGVSPYIKEIFADYGWDEYAACYMWGTTGMVYNPKLVEASDVQSWEILRNSDYARKVTVKDNVRDAYFAALGILNKEELLSGEITDERRSELLNSTDEQTVAKAEKILKEIKDNVYSFETDSGKADMITGKVAANFQWSGDAVLIMDEAESDMKSPTELWYSVPDECTNLWFDGWVMLKDGIAGDQNKKTAAEAFVNFLSRPDNAIRNMYFIGYSSSIADEMVYDYVDYNYSVILDQDDEEFDEELTQVCEYDLSYFFGTEKKLYVDASQFEIDMNKYSPQSLKIGEEYGNLRDYEVFKDVNDLDRGRQIFAQYPPAGVIERSVIMLDFGGKLADINEMWINVRCLDLKDFNPAVVWPIVAIVIVAAVCITLYCLRYKLFIRKNKP